MGKTDEETKTGLNKYDLFFGHGVSGVKKNRFTIAIVPTSETSVDVGVAVCSKNDTFVKKIGRQIAEGRARKKPTLSYANVDTKTIEGMLQIKKTIKDMIALDVCAVKEVIRKKNQA